VDRERGRLGSNGIPLQNFHPDIKEKASIYVPAIGKVTIVVLMRNLLRLVQNKPHTNGGS
jgi:methylenetetrahydrofolate dehydrogenase (NAD+)